MALFFLFSAHHARRFLFSSHAANNLEIFNVAPYPRTGYAIDSLRHTHILFLSFCHRLGSILVLVSHPTISTIIPIRILVTFPPPPPSYLILC